VPTFRIWVMLNLITYKSQLSITLSILLLANPLPRGFDLRYVLAPHPGNLN